MWARDRSVVGGCWDIPTPCCWFRDGHLPLGHGGLDMAEAGGAVLRCAHGAHDFRSPPSPLARVLVGIRLGPMTLTLAEARVGRVCSWA